MNIAFLSADLGISLRKRNGPATHLGGLLGALTSLGHHVTFIAPEGAGDEGLVADHVPIPEVGVSRVVADKAFAEGDSGRRRVFRALRHVWHNAAVEQTLESFLERARPDLLLERYAPYGVAGALVARRCGVPHLLQVNAPLAWEGQTYRRQALHEAASALEWASFRHAGRIAVVSGELRDLLVADGVEPAKIRVISCGVDADLFADDKAAAPEAVPGRVTVGFVGSLKAWHGIEVLLDAFRLLAADPRFHLLVVGDGPLAPAIEELAGELPGRVTLTGAVPVEDVASYVRSMDIPVAPYPELERFYFSPLKVLEYMAAGRPVVASGIGQLREWVVDGETGVLVPPGDVEALATAIRKLAEDDEGRRAMGRRGAQLVRTSHTWAHRAQALLDWSGVG